MAEPPVVARKSRASWLLGALILTTGVALGLGFTTFVYADGAAYLQNNPAACANCHVMKEQLAGWERGSHHAVATCNDCHAPHNLVGKLWTKARNGYFHSLRFTTGDFHEPITITQTNREVTQGTCRYCHAPIVETIDAHPKGEELDCINCHRSVGHLH